MPDAARLIERFFRYVRCGSESRNEQQFALMVEQELDRLGAEHKRQDLGKHFFSNGWNIYGRLPGDCRLEPVLFVLHLDTVAPGEGIEPVIDGGIIRSSGPTVLGADGKAGIAIVLEALERLREQGIGHRPVEFLFTICQEVDLSGAKYARLDDIVSRQAILLDHTTFAEIVCESPEKRVITYEITGRKAHAALRCEEGINALQAAVEIVHGIPLGRVDDDSIINIGDFVSLSPTNVVPDHARFDLEVRSFDRDRVRGYLEEIENRVREICGRYGAGYAVTAGSRSESILTDPDAALVQDMLRAMAEEGVAGKLGRTFGQSDSVPLQPRGISCINVGVGSRDLHSTQESIPCEDMERMVRVICRFLRPGSRKGT